MKTERLPAPVKQSESESELASEQHPVTARCRQPLRGAEQAQFDRDVRVERLARRIAANGLERLDELTHIGLPVLDEHDRAVVETALFYAARGVLES